ncbi:DUF2066 domain-containing protein [Marinomonas piezotolerans]|uniref:DUF2066 domain-containing protein n=1 Tax=Marinomonas piezotolerans TaxID=2213058 RepID=A0A370U7U9_9GAMM|nr:DUF2066 domain-containing protein [Marinomonas piezotolerans]RDL43833.1 DUF2066 domain-containing protein [Marinomonas piezotolerans]
MILRHIFLFTWLFFGSMSLHAVTVANLYSASVQLPARLDEPSLLKQAFNQAVDEVLVRVSGQAESLDGRVLEAAHENVSGWVAQHTVTTLPNLVEFDGEIETAKQVNVSFYRESINRFLFSNNLPVWGSNRPSILVWLVQDTAGVREMAGAKQPSNALSNFFVQSKKLGLPTYAPLIDDHDKQALGSSALWGFFEEDILSASQRYQTDVVFAMRMGQYGTNITVDGVLLIPTVGVQRISLTGAEESLVMKQVSEQLALLLSQRYASIRSPGSSKQFAIRVSGVENYSALERLKNYLISVGVVREAHVTQIQSDIVEFSLQLDGTIEIFKNSIALNSVLSPVSLSALDPDANRVEMFQYKGK